MSAGAYEFVELDSLQLARECWDNAPAGVAAYDRLMILLYVGTDMFQDYPMEDVLARKFDELPAGLHYRIGAFVQRAGRFMAHGIRARRELRVAA